MTITEHTDDRLTITEGKAWLLAMFGLGVVVMGVLVWRAVPALGVFNEITLVALAGLLVSVYGVLITRLTTFSFDGAARTVTWRRRGVVPSSGSLSFDQVERPVLDIRTDRRETRFFRVLLARDREQAVPVTRARTRDLFGCLDVLDAVEALLGRENAAGLIARGNEKKAVRLLENRYGVERKDAQGYLARLTAPPEADSACSLPP